MSSTMLKAIINIPSDKHSVGNLSNWNKAVVNGGARVKEDVIENFSIVGLSYATDGVRECSYLSADADKGYLIASVEDYMEEFGEGISNFYNAKGEMARIVVLEPLITRFDTSNFVLDDKNASAKKVANNMKVHWDAKTKKFLVSNGATDNAGYANAGNKFVVVEADSVSIDGQKTIRLECVK